jgi:NAD-dependent dihydropyrimidine dehydrogenase PreA subunit
MQCLPRYCTSDRSRGTSTTTSVIFEHHSRCYMRCPYHSYRESSLVSSGARASTLTKSPTGSPEDDCVVQEHVFLCRWSAIALDRRNVAVLLAVSSGYAAGPKFFGEIDCFKLRNYTFSRSMFTNMIHVFPNGVKMCRLSQRVTWIRFGDFK